MTRLARLFVVVFLCAMNAPAATAPFYLGTYTHGGKSQGIYRGTLDTGTGALGPLVLAAQADDPSFLALSPDGKYLYAAIEKGGGAAAAFAVQGDGLLAPLNVQPSGGAGTCHVSVDAAGKRVYVANYTGGSVASFPVAADGSLGERDGFVPFTGSGPNPKRQNKPHAHSIYPFGGFVYACDLGTDTVHAWTAPFADDHPAQVPPGAGVRHLAFSADGRFVYAVNEMGCTVTTFARDPQAGTLRPLATDALFPADTASLPTSTAGEVVLSPSGKRLYVSTRGQDMLTTFDIGAEGRLTFRQIVPSVVKTPRTIAVDPSGKWLVAAGQDDDRMAVFKIDAETGALSPAGEPVAAGGPVCVLFTSP